jgi:hypothetical protein
MLLVLAHDGSPGQRGNHVAGLGRFALIFLGETRGVAEAELSAVALRRGARWETAHAHESTADARVLTLQFSSLTVTFGREAMRTPGPSGGVDFPGIRGCIDHAPP